MTFKGIGIARIGLEGGYSRDKNTCAGTLPGGAYMREGAYLRENMVRDFNT